MHICFVCTGNICRSPSAAIILAEHLRRAGLDGKVQVSSAGIGGWHEGEGIDSRAGAALERRGYEVEHTAAQIGDVHLGADLFVALDRGHERALRRIVADPERVRLLRSFDPAAGGDVDVDVPDPYYGGAAGFEEVVEMVEAAVPGLLDWVRAHPDA